MKRHKRLVINEVYMFKYTLFAVYEYKWQKGKYCFKGNGIMISCITMKPREL